MPFLFINQNVPVIQSCFPFCKSIYNVYTSNGYSRCFEALKQSVLCSYSSVTHCGHVTHCGQYEITNPRSNFVLWYYQLYIVAKRWTFSENINENSQKLRELLCFLVSFCGFVGFCLKMGLGQISIFSLISDLFKKKTDLHLKGKTLMLSYIVVIMFTLSKWESFGRFSEPTSCHPLWSYHVTHCGHTVSALTIFFPRKNIDAF